jgi:hypothetical protein
MERRVNFMIKLLRCAGRGRSAAVDGMREVLRAASRGDAAQQKTRRS